MVGVGPDLFDDLHTPATGAGLGRREFARDRSRWPGRSEQLGNGRLAGCRRRVVRCGLNDPRRVLTDRAPFHAASPDALLPYIRLTRSRRRLESRGVSFQLAKYVVQGNVGIENVQSWQAGSLPHFGSC